MTAAAVSSAEDVLRTILATTTLTLSAEAETTEPGTIDASAEITVPNGTALVDLGAVTLSVNQRARRDGADLYVLLTLPGGVSVTIPGGVTVTKVATS
ncbi:MAG: hypothetical protein IPG17_30725, partial [Sandaracinaceae bacterium]|nr:hypothetical protein [Sandaracinaceae bacterium]